MTRSQLTKQERLRRKVEFARNSTGRTPMATPRERRAIGSTGAAQLFDREQHVNNRDRTTALRVYGDLEPMRIQHSLADGIPPTAAPTAFKEKGALGYTFASGNEHYARFVPPSDMVTSYPVTVTYEFYPITSTFISASFDLELWLYRSDAARPTAPIATYEEKLDFATDTTVRLEYSHVLGNQQQTPSQTTLLMFKMSCTALNNGGVGDPGLVNLYTTHYSKNTHRHRNDVLRAKVTRRS